MSGSVRMRAPEVTSALLGRLFERAGAGRVEVVRLTDEELAVLDGPQSDHVAPLPWLSALPETEQETARTVAARSLAVRGVARPSAIDETTGDVVLAVDGDTHAVLAARRSSSGFVIAERRSDQESITHVLYVQGAAGVVDETVNQAGLHVFSAGPTAPAVDALVAFLDPAGVATTDGPAEEVDLGAAASGVLPEAEADVLLVAVLVVVTAGPDGRAEQRRLTVMTKQDEVRLAEAGTGEAGRPAALIRSVGPETLRDRVQELVSQAASTPDPS
ncbi:hypothetical protein ACIB24_20950 [Spongisporangium articulatum]|uniref:ESX secretion-associated protein EspG n=1 Tax=Spongisporangium articulatum TaxID=3362603 RepID=A0ABW8AT29_9ACTN